MRLAKLGTFLTLFVVLTFLIPEVLVLVLSSDQFGDAISYFNFLNTNIIIAFFYEMAILSLILSYLITKIIFHLIMKNK
ncbi:Uncharacterised protein [Yersinia mollaretii]|uniref:hypothetical protein n=1 Tax=Yersinia mollaretii TaxID=33060 RepID=UPI0005E605DD|nr:hypothetical protein [Yersinia mollaretii]CNJ94152.1 Uncharacterised protein [Yersinia mollaretii]